MQYTEPNILTALEEGTFSFAYGISPLLFGLLVLLIIVGVWFTYYKTTRPLSSVKHGKLPLPNLFSMMV